MRSLFGILLLSVPVVADPITVTILNQTIQSTATAHAVYQDCSDTGTIFSTCMSTGVYFGRPAAAASTAGVGTSLYSASPPPSINSLALSAFAGATYSGADWSMASISLSEDVLIAGRTGTGYLDIAFSVDEFGPAYSSAEVNGMGLGGVSMVKYGVIPFTFGQPVSLGMQAGAGADYLTNEGIASVELYLAKVYTAPPICDMNDALLCQDAGSTDITAILNAPPVPNREPLC